MNLGGHRASRFLLSYPVHISNSAKHRSAISRRIPPELCDRHALEKREGAGNAGRWPQPMARLQQKTQAAGTTGSAEHPAFPARWAYSLYVISPGTGLIAPVARALVTPQTWHQHRDARTTRFRRPDQIALVWRNRSRPPHPRLTCRDDRAYAPLLEAGWRHTITVSVKRKAIYFLQKGRTANRRPSCRHGGFRVRGEWLLAPKRAAISGALAIWS